MFYFTSDLHFCHDKEFVYKARGFNSAEEMNEAIINNINNTVDEDDTLFILGDIYLNSDEGAEYFKRINSNNIHIILGNHDTPNKVDKLFGANKITDVSYADIREWGKYKFYLSHYPTYTTYDTKHLNLALINLYGHTHQTDNFFKNHNGENIPWMYNVGCDAHNCTPVSMTQIIEDCKNEFQKYITRKQKQEKEE